jgi:hypothetical protein
MAGTTPTKVDGIDYSREGVEELRQCLITLRDAALTQARMDYAVMLSHVIIVLAYFNELPRPEDCTDCED